jgi:HK97 family phage major capsid protein
MLIDAAGVVAGNNFEPSAHIMAPRTFYALAKLRDATTAGQYLRPPDSLPPRLHTKQVPINLTVGGSSDCSEVYTGDFAQCLVGIRTSLEIDVLRESLMISGGQYAMVAWLRGDVQLAQPTAFVVDRGVRGAG